MRRPSRSSQVLAGCTVDRLSNTSRVHSWETWILRMSQTMQKSSWHIPSTLSVHPQAHQDFPPSVLATSATFLPCVNSTLGSAVSQ